jgi:AcrR family transcriptional regulator
VPKKPAASRSYHHGDLRQALLDAGLWILRVEGPQSLSLRAVARRAGVSQTAPYRHFADRRALVAAIAQDGFSRMGDAMQRAAQGGETPRLALKNVARAYVDFAHEYPAEYRVMFGPEVSDKDGLDDLRATGGAVLGFVTAAIDGLQRGGLIGPGDPARIAVATWAMLHGLVMLSLDGQTANVGASRDELVEEATRIMMFGMAPR